jgi:hypothetical protein
VSDLLSRSEAKLASTAVLLTGGDGVLFANRDWTVTADGLEHANGYFIEREEVAFRRGDGVWMWPVHMAEKLWCAPESFREAFAAAVQAYGIEADAGLALALAEAADPQGPTQARVVYDLCRPPTEALKARQAGRGPFLRGGASSASRFADAA